MSGDSFWLCLDTLATSFEGSREAVENALAKFERDVMQRPRVERDEVRRKVILIVAGLSRLEVRLMGLDGPNNAAV